MVKNSISTAAQVAFICEINQRTEHTYKFHPNKLKIVRQLSKNDLDQKLEICEIFSNQVNESLGN